MVEGMICTRCLYKAAVKTRSRGRSWYHRSSCSKQRKKSEGMIASNLSIAKRPRYACKTKGKASPLMEELALPTSRLLPVRLVRVRGRVATTVRLRRLVCGRLLRVVPKGHPVATDVRALYALVASAGLAQAHDRAPATLVVGALWSCVPQTAFVRLVVRVAAAGAAADGEEPEEGRDDGESGCDPGDCEGAGADVYLDVVRIEESVEGTGEGGEENCGCEGGEEGEDG